MALCLQTVADSELPSFLLSDCHLSHPQFMANIKQEAIKKNKINQTLNLNCVDINHSCNRLHLFIAFVCRARNLLDAPRRIHRLKSKNPYEIQALCPKCSTFLLKPLFVFRGNTLALFSPIIYFLLLTSEAASQSQGCVSCSSSSGS